MHHYTAWRRLANGLGFDFSVEQHETLRGLSRIDSLEKILEWGDMYMTEAEKLHLADVKNNWYIQLIASVNKSNVLPGVTTFLSEMQQRGIKLGLSSASRSARAVLDSTGLTTYFDVIIDGHATRKSKPDPEGFLMVAKALEQEPAACLVFEDSFLGVKAALFGGFTVVGVGQKEYLPDAHAVIAGFDQLSMEKLAAILSENPIVSTQVF
jgi:beta-phosphoglucomutase